MGMPSNITSKVFFYTYVLLSEKDGEHYIGYTNNLRKRLEEHSAGKNFSTRPRRPLNLIYYEACLNEEDAKQREKYLFQLAGERITGKAEETYQNGVMQRGLELEAEARNLYELLNDAKVEQIGICFPDEKMAFGCSPDGLVGEDGLLEIKCLAPHTHVGVLLNSVAERAHYPQLQGQLLVTGRKWVDIMFYHPKMPPLIVRVERDETYIQKLSAALEIVVKNVADKCAKILNNQAHHPNPPTPAGSLV